MTFLELRELVWYWLDDLQGDYFTQIQVNRWLNNAQKEVQKILLQAGENYYLKCAETLTVQNQCSYIIPDDFMEVNRVELVISGTAPNEVSQQLQRITLNQQDMVVSTPSIPAYYTLLKNKFRLYPTPNLDTYKLRIQYSYRVSDMTLDTDVPDVPAEYHEMIALKAAQDGFIKDDRVPSNLLEKMAKYEEMLKQDADNRTVDSPRSVVVTESPYYYGDF